MNIRHYLTLLLAALIALQSVAAMADAHRFHQSGTEHLTFNHEHELAADSAKKISMKAANVADPESSALQDCHHCCHCHGTAQFLDGSLDNWIITTLGKGHSNYHFIYNFLAAAPDNPPPIG